MYGQTIMSNKSTSRGLLIKVISLFSSVRVYNVLTIAVAQILAAIFIFAPEKSVVQVLSDFRLWLIVFSSASAIAAGYIINNFYDREKDLINRPQKTLLENRVRRSTLWSVYFSLNAIALVMAWTVSWKAMLFFLGYIFSMWFYSHKLKRILFVGNILAALLAISPFFALFAYFKNFYTVIFVHGLFLFLILTMRELVKDLENLRGDMAQNYHTIPVVMGDVAAKKFYTVLTVLTIIPIAALILYFPTGYMDYYFAMITGALLVCLPLLWTSGRKREYLLIHFILKVIIVGGVLSILLIDLPAILEKVGSWGF